MSALEGERARLEEILRRPPPSPVRLHPPLAESHRRRVASLAAWLEQEEGRTEALEIIRSRIERVAITPLEGGGFEIGIEGEVARMVEIAMEPEGAPRNAKTALRDTERRLVKLVAGARNRLDLLLVG